MIEIEIKAPAGHNATIKALKDAGAVFEKALIQSDTYYNAPHRDFKDTDEALRLRQHSGKVFMTYKGKKLDAKSKSRKEVEVEVGDHKKMEDILVSLGFKKTIEVVKERHIYHLNDVEISLDKVEGLGDYVELEIQAKDISELDKKRDYLISLMRSLGIKGEMIRESYLEMLLNKKGK